MAQKFIEKHKRKSLLALLLLLFRGRNKYIVLLVVAVIFSLPFVVTQDMAYRFISFTPVKYLLKAMGYETVMSSIDENYSNEIIRTMFKKYGSAYISSKVVRKLFGYTEYDERKGMGSIAMVKAGYFPEYEKSKYAKNKKNKYDKDKDEMEGYVDKDVKDEYGPDGVNLDSILSGNIKDLGGEGGAGSMGGLNGSSNYRVYLDKSIVNSGVGYAGYDDSDMVRNALGNIGKNIPDVNSPYSRMGKIKRKRTSSASGFMWKNVGRFEKGGKVGVKIGGKRALFQMGQALATSAFARQNEMPYEYKASYTGSTYDGNAINKGLIVAEGEPVASMPDNAYLGDVVEGAEHWEELAKECSDAQSSYGTRISQLQKEIDDLLRNNKPPKKCCNCGAVKRWNSVVDAVIYRCNEINKSSTELGKHCQNSSPQILDCGANYGGLYMKCCKCKKGFGGFLGFIALAIFALVGALIGFMVAGLMGALIGAAIGLAVGSVMSGSLMGGLLGALVGGAGLAYGSKGAYFGDKDSGEAIKITEEVNKDVADEVNKDK